MMELNQQIEQARKENYTDAEILQHLSTRPDFGVKIKEAVSAGYKPEEILNHLAPTKASAPAPEPTSVGNDVLKSAGIGVPKGIIDLAGIPGNIRSTFDTGVRKILDVVGIKPPEGVSFPMPFPLPDPNLGPSMINSAAGRRVIPNIDLSSSGIQKAIEGVTGGFYEPKTVPGRYAESITRAVTGAGPLGPLKQLPLRTLTAAAGGAGAEAGEQTAGSPWGRLPGALLASTAAGLPFTMRGNAGSMIRESAKDIKPKDWAQALRVQEQARKLGVPLTAAESLPPGPIQTLAADTIASRSGGRVLSPFISKRPEQIAQAVKKNLIDPTAQASTPEATLGTAQRSATNVITNMEKARTAAVKPLYKAAAGQQISPAAIQRIGKQIDSAMTGVDKGSDVFKALNALKSRLTPAGKPITNVGMLDNLLKETRETLTTQIGATGPQRTIRGVVGPILDKLDDALKTHSPELAKGKDLYAKITDQVINPLSRGDIGRMAGKGFDPATSPPLQRVLGTISDTGTARPSTIRTLYKELNKVDKEAFPKVARLLLENQFNKAAGEVQAGSNRMVGANFRKSVFGDPQQQKNLLETMTGVAASRGGDARQVRDGVRVLMDVLGRTGRIPNVGSPTASRIESNVMARANPVAGALESVSAQPTASLASALRNVSYRKSYEQIAKALTAPDSVQQFRKLSQLGADNPKAQALIVQMLLTKQATEGISKESK